VNEHIAVRIHVRQLFARLDVSQEAGMLVHAAFELRSQDSVARDREPHPDIALPVHQID
jgi:hypothetical protein